MPDPITIEVHHYIHREEDDGRLARIEALLTTITTQGANMAGELEALRSEVERNTAVDQSAIALLNGLSEQIAALKNDPVALQALADSLKTSSNELAAAVVANTPTA